MLGAVEDDRAPARAHPRGDRERRLGLIRRGRIEQLASRGRSRPAPARARRSGRRRRSVSSAARSASSSASISSGLDPHRSGRRARSAARARSRRGSGCTRGRSPRARARPPRALAASACGSLTRSTDARAERLPGRTAERGRLSADVAGISGATRDDRARKLRVRARLPVPALIPGRALLRGFPERAPIPAPGRLPAPALIPGRALLRGFPVRAPIPGSAPIRSRATSSAIRSSSAGPGRAAAAAGSRSSSSPRWRRPCGPCPWRRPSWPSCPGTRWRPPPRKHPGEQRRCRRSASG